jgi:histidinol-phosphate aminotransferase
MSFSRRHFLRTLAYSGSTAALLPPAWAGFPVNHSACEPRRVGKPPGLIRLNSNENAYGPSEKAVAAMRAALASANRYPYSEYDALTDRLAKLHAIAPDRLLLGCGSTDILRAAACAFLDKNRQLIQANPTFEALEQCAHALGAEVISLRLTAKFAHDLEGMRQRISEKTGLVYICNPNNPTASLTPRANLVDFIKHLPASIHVVIDEAYHHYAGQSVLYESFIDHPIEDERIIVCRTFSKVYGLAGLRLGYAVGSPKALQAMRAQITGKGINGIATRAAIAALDDTASVSESVQRNVDSRAEFRNQAMVRSLKPIDSHANFFMMDTHHPAQEIIQHFQTHQVLIGRHFPAMDTYVRISLGTPPEMHSFWQVWDKLGYTQMHM